ncbi:hypothetical protein PABG_01843 [Paracoccidioides brasiliensis Pb03]|nr:hypothetical protein PABG_01843 [Paracoccidioides brasiliensis Pb03]
MAKTPSSSPSLLKQFSNYTNSGLGLENFLRLIQSICQVVSVTIASAAESEPWTIAWKNLALSRRYFRYFQFIDCFERAWAVLWGQDASPAGGYMLRTIALDALNIYPCPWAERVLLESYKLWFYSMVFGIAGITWQLFGPASSSTNQDTKPNGTNQEIEKNGSRKGREDTSDGSNVNANACRLVTEMVALGCDILIPGQALGWIDVSYLTVSSAAILSTLLMGKDEDLREIRRSWIGSGERRE